MPQAYCPQYHEHSYLYGRDQRNPGRLTGTFYFLVSQLQQARVGEVLLTSLFGHGSLKAGVWL